MSGGSSGSRFAITRYGPAGCQLPPRSTPSGSVTQMFSDVWTSTHTDMVESSPLFFFANRRSVGSFSPTQTGGETAVEPAGSESEYLSAAVPTFGVASPDTSFAPPDSVQPSAPLSKSSTAL